MLQCTRPAENGMVVREVALCVGVCICSSSFRDLSTFLEWPSSMCFLCESEKGFPSLTSCLYSVVFTPVLYIIIVCMYNIYFSTVVQWNLQIKDMLGRVVLSFIERCPLFGVKLYRYNKNWNE